MPLKGVFKIDFKKNAHSGEWRLLEINARFSRWHYVAARNGVNLPGIGYDYLVHGTRSQAAPRYRIRHRWLASLVRHRKVYDLFSWRDPGPFLSSSLARIERLSRRTGRLWRWLSTAS